MLYSILVFIVLYIFISICRGGMGGAIGSKIRQSDWLAWKDAVNEKELELESLKKSETTTDGRKIQMVRCFACDKPIKGTPKVNAQTSDGQRVYVGSECVKKIKTSGEQGYQPPLGGPKLFSI